MEKQRVAIVTLGDGRQEFFKKREPVVAAETEKIKQVFGERYDLFMPPVVFDAGEGQTVADAISRENIHAVIIHLPVWATPRRCPDRSRPDLPRHWRDRSRCTCRQILHNRIIPGSRGQSSLG